MMKISIMKTRKDETTKKFIGLNFLLSSFRVFV
jgi:hypothetical protein